MHACMYVCVCVCVYIDSFTANVVVGLFFLQY